MNVVNRMPVDAVAAAGLVGLECASYAHLRLHSNETIFAMVDALIEGHGTMDPDEFAEMEQAFGMKYEPHALLFNQCLRQFILPSDHLLQDPMHILANDGVANTQCACVLTALVACGIGPDHVKNYALRFTLPKKHGAVDATWFSKSRISTNKMTISSFAGIMISMVPIMATFLTTQIPPLVREAMADHIQCFLYLYRIMQLIWLGPDDAMRYIDDLQRLIEAHHALYSTLYPDFIKPKYHKLMHVVHNMAYLKKCLTCFATERKHRTAKRAALHVFRHIESTVVADLVDKQCTNMINGMDLFETNFLITPDVVLEDAHLSLQRANAAVLRCGEIKRKDVVCLKSDHRIVVGEVVAFWCNAAANDNSIIAQINAYRQTGEDEALWDSREPRQSFHSAIAIIDAVPHAVETEGVIRAILPFTG